MIEGKTIKEKKAILKKYLGQYYRARGKKDVLKERRESLRREMEMPISCIRYSAVPKSITNSIGEGAASISYRIAEIDERIENQTNDMSLAMLNVMDIMDFLPSDSIEREILEYRHIDCMSWKEITEQAHMVRSSCTSYYAKGLEMLLQYPRVLYKIDLFCEKEEERKQSGENRKYI